MTTKNMPFCVSDVNVPFFYLCTHTGGTFYCGNTVACTQI